MDYRANIAAAAAIIIASAAVFAATLSHALWYAPEYEPPSMNPPVSVRAASSTAIGTKGARAQAEAPKRLTIPALEIDAQVQKVGINAKGGMGAPSNFSDVAWYRYGAAPGEMGSAVIGGHVDNGLGLDGVFKRLGDIRRGDSVYVELHNGERRRFVVTEVTSYSYFASPDDLIFNRDDAPRLNLITCEGTWVKADKTYSRRLVVYTTLAP